jgi:UDP-2-acetamido-2-deoxy-ribo-hexuluronate aminotransferase
MAIAKKHNLAVIEDVAQAIGANYYFSKSGAGSDNPNSRQKAGTIGTVGCTSFFPSKNLGCYGDGGAIFTNDDALAAKLRVIANHGQTALYYHDEIGVNSRLDSIQAAILRIKLRHLDDYAEARRRVADYYDKAFANFASANPSSGGHPKLVTPKRFRNSDHVFHQYTLILKNADRNKLREYLASKEIPSMIYYPVPLHLQKAYQDARYKQGDFPVTEILCASVLSLPIHTEMKEEVQKYICEEVIKGLENQ